MRKTANEFDRVGVVTRLAELNPRMGRTALVKYAYLLQEVKGVPLGYDFGLFSYGPYDSEVLATNSYAKVLQAVMEQPVEFPAGLIKNELRQGANAEEILKEAKEFLADHDDSIKWVVDNFRRYNAGEMELIGTMVFADREANDRDEKLSQEELIKTVLEIKPHFTLSQASTIYERLDRLGLLIAIRAV